VLAVSPAWAAHIVHSPEGSFDGADAPGGPFQHVLGIAIDNSGGGSDGDAYIAGTAEAGETLTGTVYKFDENGSYTGVELNGADTPQGSFSFVAAHGIFALSLDALAVDSSEDANSGDVYVADAEHGVVDRFSDSGEYLCQITGRPTPSGSECAGLGGSATPADNFVPTAVTVSSGGVLYVADAMHHVIDKFNKSGSYIGQITDFRIGQPASIGLDATDSLYVLNYQYFSGESVLKFDPSGHFVSVIDSDYPVGLGVDPDANYVYVSHGEDAGITEYDSRGRPAGSFGSGANDLYASLAIGSSSGRVYAGNFFPEPLVHIYSPNIFLLDATTQAATSVGETTATLNGIVDPASSGEVTSCEFEYGPTTSYGQTAPCRPAAPYSSRTAVTAELGGLAESAAYHFRVHVTNAAGTAAYGEDEAFYILDATTQAATSVGETTATLNGIVDPASSEVTSCEFEYGPTTSYGQTAPCGPAAPYSGRTAVTAELGRLVKSATYHFRVHVTNAAGIGAYGEDESLDTQGPPTIDELPANEVSRATASLWARVNPHGLDTEVRFVYVDADHFDDDGGFASSATKSTLSTELGSGVSSLLTGQGISALAVNTTYHYRLIASNAAGVVEGSGRTFTTLPVARIGDQWAYAHVKGATVEAKIDPLGLDTSCQVQYVNDAEFLQTGYAHAASEPCVAGLGSGTGDVNGRAELDGLDISAAYHFRFVATNQSGSLTGADETFSTFGIESFSVQLVDEKGDPYTQAGGHPYERITHYGLNHTFVPTGVGSLDAFIKDVTTEQAPGQTGGQINGIPKCAGYKVDEETCSSASQIGTVKVEYVNGEGVSRRTTPLYEAVPPEGVASRFATVEPYTATDSRVRTGTDYGSTSSSMNITEEARVVGVTVVVWGVPADHNQSGMPRSADIRNPTACTGPLKAYVRADTWELPGQYATASTEMPATTGCDKLEFHPSIEWQPTTHVADSPTGLHVDVHEPQNDDPDGLAFADLEDAIMSPAGGLILNPAGASGLTGCSPARIGLHEETPARCPDSSKVGTAEIDTPLVDHPLLGGIYLATPHDNPFGSMFAIYVAINDPKTGVALKLAGNIQASSNDGQLTSRFSETPQLPVEDFKLDFFGGPRSVLSTPAECGTFITKSTLTPWSAPQSGPPAHPTDSYEITATPDGSACVYREADATNRPEFRAGTSSPDAGAYSPFAILLRRDDGSQRIAGLKVTPPPGLLGRLAGLPRCPDAAIAAAGQRSGTEEQMRSSCPASSEVGTVVVGAGAGTDPYYVKGKAYIGGPYRGAPLSLAVIVPAVAGPFDLGTVVVRTPLQVDLESGQMKVESDPIPSVLEGVPLDVRTIAVKLDRPEFTLNPTSCDLTETNASVTSLAGQAVALSDPFQVGGCDKLGFAPKVNLRLLGKTRRRAHPAVRAVLKMPKGGANIARIAVAMPPTEFLDTGHIRGICTREQFAVGACPANSIYGHAEAWSPLLDKPLSGPVFMRSSIHRLPDLVTELNGEFRLAFAARMGSAHGGVQANVAGLPDAPVTKFVMTMRGRGRGLLQNSVDACAQLQRALIEMEAQNGRIAVLHPRLRAKCPPAAGGTNARG
jgi:hypothetical protein